ncbi:MAG TPA: Smr/MutS family protein [Lysobacter sp.]|nr:Smr/MutS family protein [Lysobacter sp.]
MTHEHDDRDDDEAGELFRAAVGPVRRLPETPPPPAPPRPAPRARMAERDEAEARDSFRHALEEAPLLAGDALSYRRPAVPPRAWQRLRRGEIAVQDELDLHGTTQRDAEALLRDFLHAAHRSGFGCVRIVHGKGRHLAEWVDDGGTPVLKNLVDRLLRQRSEVMAFHSAPPAQGGTGAVLVLLAPPKRR